MTQPGPIMRRVVGLVAFALCGGLGWADRVTERDGRVTEGHVISVDESSVIVDTGSSKLRLDRGGVVSIEFGPAAESPPPLKIEIRNVRSDDAVDVWVDDELVIDRAREGGEWIDLTDKLKDGNNAIRLRIHNARSGWAYHLGVRINGSHTRLQCGTPLRADRSCDCCGFTGRELGEIDLPVIWIHVDRALGFAEVLQ